MGDLKCRIAHNFFVGSSQEENFVKPKKNVGFGRIFYLNFVIEIGRNIYVLWRESSDSLSVAKNRMDFAKKHPRFWGALY